MLSIILWILKFTSMVKNAFQNVIKFIFQTENLISYQSIFKVSSTLHLAENFADFYSKSFIKWFKFEIASNVASMPFCIKI